MTVEIEVPAPGDAMTRLEMKPGTTTILVGANGSGKTRLATWIEETQGDGAHRVAAHRALALNPGVPKISEAAASRKFRFGHEAANSQVEWRRGHRWTEKAEVALLNDFDALLQVLFAEQSNVALCTHNAAHEGTLGAPLLTKFQRLRAIWSRVLPSRNLNITGDDILVSRDEDSTLYGAAEMSDGERAVFYMVGQVLAVPDGTLIVFDEPELHVHRSILARLWDEIEAARPDCAFLLITHDLEFAASRPSPTYVLRDFHPPAAWTVEPVPEGSGFPEDVAALILGSRMPVLFVEGGGDGLDLAIYRACYPGWTVVPCGGCEAVIRSVGTMRAHPALSRIACAGLIDRDGRTEAEREAMLARGIGVLPVAELENLFLLPNVARAVAETDGYAGPDLARKLHELAGAVMTRLREPGVREEVVARHCRRHIDAALKRIDLSGSATTDALATALRHAVAGIDVATMRSELEASLAAAEATGDVAGVLVWLDEKTLLADVAKILKAKRKNDFVAWAGRVMKGEASGLRDAIRASLPRIEAR